MGNAATTNLVLYNPAELFHAVWKLTRTMLFAGWRYMSSSNGQLPGCINAAQSGSTASVTAFSTPLATITVPINIGAMLTGTCSETNASASITFSQNQTLNIGDSLVFSLSGPTNYGTPLAGTVSIANGSANITFSQNQTLTQGSTLVFTSSSQPTTFYVLNAAVTGATAGTLTTNFTGVTDTTSTVSYLAALSGTFTLAATNSVTTSASQVGVVQPGDYLMFSPQPDVTYVVATVGASTITLTTSYTGTTGAGKFAVDLGGQFYFLNAAVSGTTAGTLQTNYTGTTSTASTVNHISAL